MSGKSPTLMTLRVSRDGGRTWSRRREIRASEAPADVGTCQYPPCQCPRCRPKREAEERAVEQARRRYAS